MPAPSPLDAPANVKGSPRLRRRLKSASGQGFALAWPSAAVMPLAGRASTRSRRQVPRSPLLPRPPCRSACGGSRCAARSRLACPAPVRPQGLPAPPGRGGSAARNTAPPPARHGASRGYRGPGWWAGEAVDEAKRAGFGLSNQLGSYRAHLIVICGCA